MCPWRVLIQFARKQTTGTLMKAGIYSPGKSERGSCPLFSDDQSARRAGSLFCQVSLMGKSSPVNICLSVVLAWLGFRWGQISSFCPLPLLPLSSDFPDSSLPRAVLLREGCCSQQAPQSGWLCSRRLFATVLEAGSQTTVSTGLVSLEASLLSV